MLFLGVDRMDFIKKGDQLIIKGLVSGDLVTQLHKVVKVKVSDNDGTEIILKKKGNLYFNLGMYLEQKSWVREVYIIR
jgi:hypothetical protein